MNCPGAAARRRSIAGAPSSISSVCSIITTASAPRGITPPVAIAVAVPGVTVELRRMAAGEHLGIEREAARRRVARAGGVGGAQREAVDIGAVERRHVDRRRDVVRSARGRARRRAQRSRRRAATDRDASRTAPWLPPPRRLRGTAPAARPRAPHRAARSPSRRWRSFMGTPASQAGCLPRKPSLSGGTSTQPSARVSACIGQ